LELTTWEVLALSRILSETFTGSPERKVVARKVEEKRSIVDHLAKQGRKEE
jgi:hypothetical protein